MTARMSEAAAAKKHGADFGRRRGSQSRPGKERVEGSDREGEAPNSGDRGELEKSEIRGGGITQQIPRKTDFREDARGRIRK